MELQNSHSQVRKYEYLNRVMIDRMLLQKAEVRRLNKDKEELSRRLHKREQELHERRLHKSPLRSSPDKIDKLLKEVQNVA